MYELEHGTARLVNALHNRPEKIEILAYHLDYLEDQLKEDIQALYDFYQKNKEKEIER